MNLWFRLLLMLLRRPWRKPVDGLATTALIRSLERGLPALARDLPQQ